MTLATDAASMSPSWGPLLTASTWMEVTRPRSASGVSSWTSDDRKTADSTSAPPAIARKTSARPNENVDRPNATIAAPQTMTAMTIARPVRRTDETQPDSSAAPNAPTAGAAASNPRPAGPVRKTSRARTGNSADGIPKIIASRSMTKVDRMTRRRAANRGPSTTAEMPGRAMSPMGGSGEMASNPTMTPTNVSASRRYAVGGPAVAMTSPPIAGPTIEVAW